jgi:hypothetical protein
VHALSSIVLAAAGESHPSRVPFYVLGGLLATWAVAVSVVGLTQPDFPRSQGMMRAVCAVSALLMAAAMTAAVATS